MKYKIPKKQKGGFLLKENNSLDPIYEGGMIPAAVSSYKYTMEDYDNLASKKNLNQVPSVLQNGVMKARVRGAINKGVKDVLLPTIGVAAAPIISAPIISSAIASPSAFIGSMIGGIFGQVATDKIVQKTSGNKYSGWGDMVSKKTGLNPTVSEFTNPGGLIGGGLGTQTKKIIQKILPRYKQIPVKIDNNLIQKSITINKSIPKNNILNTPETFAKVTAQARENIKQLLDNPIVQETMVRNTELSKRLGIKFPLIPTTDPNSIMSRTTSINEYRRMMLDKSINVKVDNLPLHVGANYNRSTKDLIYN